MKVVICRALQYMNHFNLNTQCPGQKLYQSTDHFKELQNLMEYLYLSTDMSKMNIVQILEQDIFSANIVCTYFI